MSVMFMIQAAASPAKAAAGATDKMTLHKLFGGLPTDPASIVVFVLVIISIGLVLWAGRRTSHPSDQDQPPQEHGA